MSSSGSTTDHFRKGTFILNQVLVRARIHREITSQDVVAFYQKKNPVYQRVGVRNEDITHCK